MHPGGIVETDLSRLLSSEVLQDLGVFNSNNDPIHDPSKGLKNISQGAATTVWCATNPQLKGIGGVYCENSDIANLNLPEYVGDANSNTKSGVMSYALEPESAEKLWMLSEKLVGFNF